MLTSVGEWSAVANGMQPTWEPRSRTIAKLIRATDSVLDIGAGNQKLARFIPPMCRYIPVDCVADLPGTFVVDFNKEFRLPDTDFNVVVCAGFLEYVDDVPAFFRELARHAPGRQIIFTYMFGDDKKSRTEMKVHNDYQSSDELLAAVGASLSYADEFAYDRRTGIYNATLSSGQGNGPVNRHRITDILEKREPRIVRLFRRMGRSIRKRFPKAKSE
ncbi:SAM-dependent methyltransferase [Aminobacter niigataensis]|uniref:SAM-dependent methyltransferase n=1 Tax=Aminobacter niigataensis TaxID=83265 RepID=A0ABR6L893_9HYPH|nr:class I SAM-dependent methyltransferase [Aminobacter niigataensis]MBB4653027.1 SAM-dependent methyltransferase [Aminobacter niigataensis]